MPFSFLDMVKMEHGLRIAGRGSQCLPGNGCLWLSSNPGLRG